LWEEREPRFIICQMRHIRLLRNIDDLITTDGIDGTIIGPYDLSALWDMLES